jgi:hypothetical protein
LEDASQEFFEFLRLYTYNSLKKIERTFLKMKNKKYLCGALAAMLIATSPVAAFAESDTLINSTSSTYSDVDNSQITTGEDRTQGKTYTETSIDNIQDTTYENTSEVEVYATRTSTFSVVIPKIITLDGQTKKGNYQTKVKGDIAGSQKISVTAPETFQMSEQNASVAKKDDVTATIATGSAVNAAKTTWTQSEIKLDTYEGTGTTTGEISAQDLTAGSWKGTFDFTIKLDKVNQ